MIQSFDPKNNRHQIFKTSRLGDTNKGGRSGSFFFFSEDKRFIIKTITKIEITVLLNILQDFYNHCDFLNSESKTSLIAKIYGLFTVEVENMSPISLMIMPNLIIQVD